jgi:hypothetical protein
MKHKLNSKEEDSLHRQIAWLRKHNIYGMFTGAIKYKQSLLESGYVNIDIMKINDRINNPRYSDWKSTMKGREMLNKVL